jgi:hypothetical protein
MGQVWLFLRFGRGRPLGDRCRAGFESDAARHPSAAAVSRVRRHSCQADSAHQHCTTQRHQLPRLPAPSAHDAYSNAGKRSSAWHYSAPGKAGVWLERLRRSHGRNRTPQTRYDRFRPARRHDRLGKEKNLEKLDKPCLMGSGESAKVDSSRWSHRGKRFEVVAGRHSR